MVNTNTIIRDVIGFIENLSPATEVRQETFSIDEELPNAPYVLVTVSEKNETAVSKKCNDYMLNLEIEILQAQRKGFFSSFSASLLEGLIEENIQLISFSGATRKNVKHVNTVYNRREVLPTVTASSILMRFDLWLKAN